MSAATGTTTPRPFWRDPMFIITAGCLISMLSFGLRSTYGLFNDPITEAHGWNREVFAFAIALQNLVWGLAQPVAGIIADRYGTARVLVIGGLLYIAGLALTAVSTTPLTLTLSAGVLVGLGLSGASMSIVITAFGKLVSEERRSWAMGIGTAAGSAGQLLFAPLGQAFISAYGWQTALLMLAGAAVFLPLLAGALKSDKDAIRREAEVEMTFTEAMRAALRHSSYLLLIAGFFVCGFQLAFITVHLPPYLSTVGVDVSIAAWAIAVIGLFNIIGSYVAGVLGGRRSKRYLLSWLYIGRAAAIAIFISVPQNVTTVLVFSAIMGLMWLSTVPLTSGLVAVMFGTRYLATLFGIVFLSHQVGSFLGVWLGGILFDRFGNYDLVWWLAVVLGLFAALVHLPIVETRVQRFVAAG